MAIELVDGHANKPHISGEDLGDFKAGILGNDGYVFNRANKLAATLNGSNSITIDTGSGILPVSGRHFRVTAPETLTITSGTQGQNRNDLCVVRANTSEDGTNVEDVQLLILRGTPTSGAASDPEIQDGDLLLYRIQLTGVSVSEPIALFSVMVPYNDFRESISPVEIKVTSSFSSTEIKCEQWGKLVVVSWGGTVPAMSSDSAIVAATGLPPCRHPFYASTGIRANANAKWVDVNSNGELKFENRSSEDVGSCVWAGEIVYFAS